MKPLRLIETLRLADHSHEKIQTNAFDRKSIYFIDIKRILAFKIIKRHKSTALKPLFGFIGGLRIDLYGIDIS